MDINIDLQRLKALPLRLKLVAAVIAADIVLVSAAWLLLDDMIASRESEVTQLRSQLNGAKRQAAESRRQIDAYPQLLQHYQEAVAQGMTGDLDRLKLVHTVQDSADRYHLADLKYKLVNENEKPDVGKKLQVNNIRIEFDSGAILDTDALAFWSDILDGMTGHYQVAEARLERTQGPIDAAVVNALRDGRPVSTMKVKIEFLWTSLIPVGQDVQ